MAESEMNTELLRNWLAWLERAGRWLATGPPVQTPISFRRERLALVLEEGRRLSRRRGQITCKHGTLLLYNLPDGTPQGGVCSKCWEV